MAQDFLGEGRTGTCPDNAQSCSPGASRTMRTHATVALEACYLVGRIFPAFLSYRLAVAQKSLIAVLKNKFTVSFILIYLQCFDAVGWAAGRASGL